MNILPFEPNSHTEMLTAIHLPIALWIAVAFAYVGGQWRSHQHRMNYVRFSGEWFIYFTLIALGGGVLMGFTLFLFEAIDLDAETLVGMDLPLRDLGRPHKRMAGRIQAERHREHGPRSHTALHAAIRRLLLSSLRP